MKKTKKILLLVVVVIISMFVGAVIYATWFAGYVTLTEQLVHNSYNTYETQNKMIQNYDRSYDLLANCLKEKNCNIEQSLAEMQLMLEEREQLKGVLFNLGEETKQILTELSRY